MTLPLSRTIQPHTHIHTHTHAHTHARVMNNTTDVAAVLGYSCSGKTDFENRLSIGVITVLFTVGTLVNAVTMYVLYTSPSIRKMSCYVLVMNQTIVDLLVSFLNGANFLIVNNVYYLRTARLDGALHYTFCLFIANYGLLFILCTVSSYNLVLYSLDILISIKSPVYHKTRVDNRKRKWAVALLWVVIPLYSLLFIIPTNGFSAIGKCYFFNRFYGRWHRLLHISLFHVLQFVAPLANMTCCYVYISVVIRKLKVDAYNAAFVKTGLRVMFGYIVCVIPSCAMYLAKLLGAELCEISFWYHMIMLMLVFNSTINPFIYAYQFKAFRLHLKRRMQICGIFKASFLKRIYNTST